jgi:hypothetical protein
MVIAGDDDILGVIALPKALSVIAYSLMLL